jgi:ATP-binding cassette subfamily F protein 3
MLFRLSDVHKSYGAQDVLRGTSFQINSGEHVGLVGRNGAGKTTIFRLICGEETTDEGDVVKMRGLRLGVLEQLVHFEKGTTVHEAALSAFGRLQQIEHEMHTLEHQMADAGDELEKVLERYSELQHQFEIEGGFEYAAKAESILQGLGFEKEAWNLETEKLSGGQQNRLGLACLLLAEPDVLLLDEPTNHLDVQAVEWLEDFLQTYQQAYVVISHDRYFLDRVCKRIIEIENGKAINYVGNYSEFLIQRLTRRETLLRAYENQQQLIAKTEEFIRRNLEGQKTKQAKSRRNMLARLERVESVTQDKPSGNFQLQQVERAGNNVLMVENLSVGYPEKLLARDISFTLHRGECLGIIGPNGSGKTTLIKTFLGNLEPLDGDVRWGVKTEIGYYSQQLDDLDDRNEIIMELRRVALPTAMAGELRNFLARFLFYGDDVYKQVRDLSGGEKGRLALAKLIYSRVNVLLLDEPTNHLDVPSREALEEALDAYPGTIITISHDRFFLDRVATQILELDGKGSVEIYNGNYTEYHDWKKARTETPKQDVTPKAQSTKHKIQSANENKAPKKQSTRDLDLIEKEIAELEASLAQLAEQMSQPEIAADLQKFNEVNQAFEETENLLKQLYDEWEKTTEAASI